MGGKGSGGARPGSGPKPKRRHLHLVDGTRPAGDAAATKPIEEFPPLEGLAGDDLITWEQLAPLAFEQRTLTKATAYAFSLLCRNIVLEKKLAKDEPGGADHRGLIQRIDAQLLAFNLRPNGKAIYEGAGEDGGAGKPTNPLARFGFGGR